MDEQRPDDRHTARPFRLSRHPIERRLLLVIAASAAILALKAGEGVWTPLAAAFVISVTLRSELQQLIGRGWPLPAVVTVSMLAIAVAGSAVIGLFSYAYLRIEADLPALLHAWQIRSLDLGVDPEVLQAWLEPGLVRDLGRQILESGMSIARDLMIMLLLVVVMLAESFRIAQRLQSPEWERRFAAWSTGAADVRQFIYVRSLTGLAAGTLAWLLLTVAEVPYAPMWGLLTVLARFVPYLGPAAIMVPPVLLTLIRSGLPRASTVLIALIFINGLTNWFLLPSLIKGRVRLPGVLALSSIVFWSWALGPMGALIGVPLTLLLRAHLLAGDNGGWLRPFLHTGPPAGFPAAKAPSSGDEPPKAA